MIKTACFKILFFGVLVFGIVACKNDVDVLAKYEENAVVYAILSASETTHFVKINKVFTNPNSKAMDVAQIADSLYFDTLTPEIVEQQTGKRIPLFKANVVLKDSGFFATAPNYLYATASNTILNPLYNYTVEFRLPKSQKLISATTNIVRPFTIQQPNLSFSNVLDFNMNARFNIRFLTPVNSKVFDAIFVFNYSETDKTDTMNITYKSISWKIMNNVKADKDRGGEIISTTVESISFYDLLVNNIQKNDNLIRKFVPCDLTIYAGNLELDTYIQSLQPSIGIVQKQSEYTNIINGVGIFSSRFIRNYPSLDLSTNTKNNIVVLDKYKFMGFVK